MHAVALQTPLMLFVHLQAGRMNLCACNYCALSLHRLDLPWWDKIMGLNFKGGRLQLKQLTGGKMDDITVLCAVVVEADAPPPPAAAEDAYHDGPRPGSLAAGVPLVETEASTGAQLPQS